MSIQWLFMYKNSMIFIFFIEYKIFLSFSHDLCYNDCYGALAQLGARNIRIVKATGSNPVCSTYNFLSGSIAQLG